MSKVVTDNLRYDKADGRTRTRISHVHRSGNSWSFYVPRHLAEVLGLDNTPYVRLYVVGRTLCVDPVRGEEWSPAVVEAAAEK